ncbi:lytic murein transglycosylase [Shewanella sp. 1CM18E]|uniref:lytic murein transglycosylase n=1 Tax=Shewanella sp. 1CM18E TaxID=2929169 RepID=UPI0020BE38F0|nr:lytic murein transglycosylase [Shewanella sp. 1CM18E]MCK8045249.1 lytic murein transglycosylase [Shewanella sp. 1CM18E]
MLSGKPALVLVSCLSVMPVAVTAQEPSQSSFSDYIALLKQEAIERGVSQRVVDDVFPKIKMFKKAQGQLPQTKAVPVTLDTYLPQAVSQSKVDWTRAFYEKYSQQLNEISQRYGVQPRFIVALWAVDSNFGQSTADYPALSVSASLAYKGEDEAFYRDQFINALEIVEREDLKYADLKSNAKGELGLSILRANDYQTYAQDGDGDGKKQPWSNTSDAFASTAYFLQQAGWNAEQTWGRQVKVPTSFEYMLTGFDTKKSFSDWQNLGVRRFNGTNLPKRDDMLISMVMPDGESGRKYLVYDNYRRLTTWNDANYFAITVVYLSERIKNPAII